MTAHPTSYAICPFAPRPEPSNLSVIHDPIAGARLPSNVCVEEHCRLWMRGFDDQGRLVAAYCAIAGITAGLGQIAGLLAGAAFSHAPAQTPAPGEGPPAA